MKCIRLITPHSSSTPLRVSNIEADRLVTRGDAVYVSKMAWKIEVKGR